MLLNEAIKIRLNIYYNMAIKARSRLIAYTIKRLRFFNYDN